jgi:putative acetyltransferase
MPAIRPERPDDAAAIRNVLDAAFGDTVESRLVERLRAGGHLVLAHVAVEGKALVGYAAWPRLRVETAAGPRDVVGLAPLAVTPRRQRSGIGSQLTRAGLAQLRARGETLVFVVGDPAYYPRFGFSAETARRYESIYAGEHFMALELNAGAPQSGRVRYPAPFDSLT